MTQSKLEDIIMELYFTVSLLINHILIIHLDFIRERYLQKYPDNIMQGQSWRCLSKCYLCRQFVAARANK